MADPGWYKDRSDPALARWFDGENWTEHTLVRADQPEGVLPPPPEPFRPPEPEPEPESWTPPSWSPPAFEPPSGQPTPPEPEPAPWTPPVVEPDVLPAPDVTPPAPEPDTVSGIVPPAPDASVEEAAQLDLFGGAPRVLAPELTVAPDPAPLGEPIATSEPVDAIPIEPGPEPGPASHLEELPPQGVSSSSPPSDAGGYRAPAFGDPTFHRPPSNRLAALPLWLRIAIPVVVVGGIVAVALSLSGGDDNGAVSVDTAVSIAQDRIAVPIPDTKVASMVDQLCGAAESGTTVSVVILAKQLPVDDRTELRAAISAMGAGAREHCPAAKVDWDGLLDDVYESAAPSFPA